MTPGEKQVWAATYALKIHRDMSYEHAPPGIYVPGKENEEKQTIWIAQCVTQAIEGAAYAVQYMREHRNAIEEGYGADDEVTIMLDEMLGDER